MADRRIFDHFGFNLPHENLSPETKDKALTEYDVWSFLSDFSDWVNSETDETLAGCQLTQELRSILTNNMNLELR
jgi:hypothetical protein